MADIDDGVFVADFGYYDVDVVDLDYDDDYDATLEVANDDVVVGASFGVGVLYSGLLARVIGFDELEDLLLLDLVL